MDFIQQFESHLSKNLRKKFNNLNTPFEIQNYLDSITYKGEERDRSPLNVMLDNQGHCLDGGFLAALCLWRIGYKPLLLDILPDPNSEGFPKVFRRTRWLRSTCDELLNALVLN